MSHIVDKFFIPVRLGLHPKVKDGNLVLERPTCDSYLRVRMETNIPGSDADWDVRFICT